MNQICSYNGFVHTFSALDCVRWETDRTARVVLQDMKRGVNSLALISTIGPFVGFFGTILGIINSFPALGTDRMTAFAVVTGRLSDSFVPIGLGVFTGIVAYCGHAYLSARLEGLNVEMKGAALQLMNQLALLPKRS